LSLLKFQPSYKFRNRAEIFPALKFVTVKKAFTLSEIPDALKFCLAVST